MYDVAIIGAGIVGDVYKRQHIDVSHDRASKTGEKITAHAEITEISGRKITFAVYAQNEKGEKDVYKRQTIYCVVLP